MSFEPDPRKLDIHDQNPTHTGISWTAPQFVNQPIILGLGGAGRVANMGELSLPNYQFPSMSTLLLNMRNMENPDRDIGPGNIRALVKYAVGAVPNDEVLMDWTFGSSLSVPAGKVNLTAIEYGVGSGARNMSVPIMLSAMLVPGPRFSLGMPTLTFAFDLIANVVETMTPPNKAKRLLVGDRRGIAGSDVQVTVRALASDNVYQLGTVADSAIRTEGVVLPGATTLIEFLSPGGTALAPITVCFLLDG